MALAAVVALLRLLLAKGGGRVFESLFEQLYEVRNIGEGALGTHLGDGLVGREQKYARAVEALLDEPLVGRCFELAAELLFEGGQRTVGHFSQRFERYIFEDVVIDDRGEAVDGGIGVGEEFAFQATVVAR